VWCRLNKHAQNMWAAEVLTARSMKTTIFWDVATCSLVDIDRQMSEAVSSSDTSADIYQITRCYIPEDSRLHAQNMFSNRMRQGMIWSDVIFVPYSFSKNCSVSVSVMLFLGVGVFRRMRSNWYATKVLFLRPCTPSSCFGPFVPAQHAPSPHILYMTLFSVSSF
jgi:hypothetical protein